MMTTMLTGFALCVTLQPLAQPLQDPVLDNDSTLTIALEEVAQAWYDCGRFHGAVVVAVRGEVLYSGAFGHEDQKKWGKY